MDSQLWAIAVECFMKERREFVEELTTFSHGKPEGRLVEEVKRDLDRMADIVSSWSGILKESNSTDHKCFEYRCLQVAAILTEMGNNIDVSQEFRSTDKKIFGMLAIQVGRTTVHGYIENDTDAVTYTRMSEQEQGEWDSKQPQFDDDRMALLRRIWYRMNVVIDGCTCKQCYELSFTPFPYKAPQ